ncbi:cytochrome b/b6 domain-containing protein [Williamsia sterculiae]|uniref:Cytochrome b561 n=1 Tax=Williamsia sterculiae TaxID=1344003 RepID=A0A1N7DLM2_9NOCA|nr:cytochrome b/b6 domain-containing protein [Williamsia sterculiae]SIR76734.1 hypothetical protein SAMN05445060_0741 [Williamsia sterculiae]
MDIAPRPDDEPDEPVVDKVGEMASSPADSGGAPVRWIDRVNDATGRGIVLVRRTMGVTVREVAVPRHPRLADRGRELADIGLAIAFRPSSPRRDTTVRSPRLTARVGLMLGACVVVCFATGLLSHWIQHPPSWFYFPSDPPWLYRLSQGVHVITGTMAIPLLLIKLQIVYPRLFARPVVGTPLRALERLSIAVLVSSMIFQLFTGLMNTAQFYPWKFFFTTTHYAMSFVIVAALMIHIAVKLPVIQQAFTTPLESTEPIDNELHHDHVPNEATR